MRLFVAADLSDEQRSELRNRVDEARQAASFDFIRWLPEENWHATLAFIGDKTAEELETTLNGIEAELATTKPLSGAPSRIQGFPHRNKPRLLALRLFPEEGIKRLHWNLSQALGIRPDRNFRLHVTVARFRDLSEEDAHALNQAIRNLLVFDTDRWQFRSVTLYESILKQSGAQYRAIRTWTQ